MNKAYRILALSFFILIIWIIYNANVGNQIFLFKAVNHIPFRDKMGHFILFGILTWCLNFGFNYRRINLLSKKFFLGTTLVTVFVVIEEFSQVFIPLRSFDLVDLLADAIGIIAFDFLSRKTGKKLENREVSKVVE